MTMTWQLDARRSHGEYGLRHALRGHRVHTLELVRGRLEELPAGELQLEAELRLPAAQATAVVHFVGKASGRHDVNRYHVHGVLSIGARRVPVELQLHDLGWSSDPEHGRRRFLAVSGSLDHREWRCGKQSPLTGRTVRFFVDAEWLPALQPLPAA